MSPPGLIVNCADDLDFAQAVEIKTKKDARGSYRTFYIKLVVCIAVLLARGEGLSFFGALRNIPFASAAP